MPEPLSMLRDLTLYEGVDVEFKAARGGLPRDLWETYSAFANTDGGTIWLGITQGATALDMHGVDNPEKLFMVSMLPQPTVEGLRHRFGQIFGKLNVDEVQALVTADLEGEVSNQRLQEMSLSHPVDITKVLQGLVRKGMLEPSGTGRGTRYRLVSGNSLHNSLDSLHNSLDSSHRDSDSSHSVATEITEKMSATAAPAQQSSRIATAKLEEILLALCSEQFVSLDMLAEAVSRNPDGLRNRYLTPLVRQGRLRLRFPDRKNRPDQAYRAVSDK